MKLKRADLQRGAFLFVKIVGVLALSGAVLIAVGFARERAAWDRTSRGTRFKVSETSPFPSHCRPADVVRFLERFTDHINAGAEESLESDVSDRLDSFRMIPLTSKEVVYGPGLRSAMTDFRGRIVDQLVTARERVGRLRLISVRLTWDGNAHPSPAGGYAEFELKRRRGDVSRLSGKFGITCPSISIAVWAIGPH